MLGCEPLESRFSLSVPATYLSAQSLGTSDNPIASQMAADRAGNLFVARTSSHGGQIGLAISRYSASGVRQWTQVISNKGFVTATDVAVGDDGAVWVTGMFQGVVDFDPGKGNARRTSAGQGDGYLLKLNGAGQLLWMRQFGGPQSDSGYSLAAYHDMVYLSGNLEGRGRNDLILPGAGDFVAAYSSAGQLRWAVRHPARCIASDSAGNVYSTGQFFGSVDFDPSPSGKAILASGAAGDLYLSKLTSSGQHAWATHWGSGRIIPQDLAVDSRGSLFVTGTFSDPLDFVTPKRTFHLVPPNGDAVFLARYNSAGQGLWARTTTAKALTGGAAYALTTDTRGNALLAGEAYGYTPTATLLVQKFAPGGTCLSSTTFEGTSIGHDIVAAPSGAWVLGSFSGAFDANPAASHHILTTPQNATFLLRLKL